MERLRDVLQEGFAYSLRPPEWVRGPGVVEDETVRLEDRQRERYQPHVHAEAMLFDLASLSSEHDVTRFVRQYGLLTRGPDAEEHSEPLEDWRVASGFLASTLALYEDLVAYVDRLDASRYDALRGHPLVQAHAAGEPVPIHRDELEDLASRALAHSITAGLGDVRMRVAADVESEGGGEPGLFRYFFEPSDLIGHAFAELAHLIVQRAPLARCPECSRFFAVEHGRQQFCTPTCAARARQRRFTEKRKRKEAEDAS